VTDDDRAAFVERQRRERVAAGLTPNIEDPRALALLGGLIAGRERRK
jgi:hypothetical protein